jgi:hypothetical protein
MLAVNKAGILGGHNLMTQRSKLKMDFNDRGVEKFTITGPVKAGEDILVVPIVKPSNTPHGCLLSSAYCTTSLS